MNASNNYKSALGNYIHLFKENYDEYGIGIGKGHKKTLNNYNFKFNKRENNNVENEIAQKLTEIINSYKKNLFSSNSPNLKAKKDELQEKFGKDFNEFLTVVNNSSNTSISKIHFKKVGNVYNLDGNGIEKLEQLSKNLKAILNKTTKDEKLIIKKLNEGTIDNYSIKNLLEKQGMSVEVCAKLIKKFFADYSNLKKAIKSNSVSSVDLKGQNVDWRDLVHTVNSIIEVFYKKYSDILLEGKLYEDIITSAVGDVIKNGKKIADLEITNAINRGDDNVKVDKIKIASLSDTKSIVNKGMYTLKEHSTKSKVDISVEINAGEEPEFINISAKNMKFGKNFIYIHAVTDTSLIDMLYSLGDIDLINHYFNIYSNHLEKNKKGKAEKISHLEDTKEIYKYLKIKMLDVALTSPAYANVNKKDKANYLAVNDKTTGDTKVVPINRILNKLEEEFNGNKNVANIISVKIGQKRINDFYYTNKKVNKFGNSNRTAALARISSFLSKVHKLKVSVGFNAMSSLNN